MVLVLFVDVFLRGFLPHEHAFDETAEAGAGVVDFLLDLNGGLFDVRAVGEFFADDGGVFEHFWAEFFEQVVAVGLDGGEFSAQQAQCAAQTGFQMLECGYVCVIRVACLQCADAVVEFFLEAGEAAVEDVEFSVELIFESFADGE